MARPSAGGYSYAGERDYYSRNWPTEASGFRDLVPYVGSWLDAGAVFGGKRVLDLGAGECTYSRMIAEAFRPRLVLACDLFAERLRPASKDNGAGAVRFVAGDAFHLPFANQAFDVVFGSLVLCQVRPLAAIVAEIDRVTAAGGMYIGIEPNPFNALHLMRYWRGCHSPNQYLLRPRHLEIFREYGFEVSVRFFYGKLRWVRDPVTATCMGIRAAREARVEWAGDSRG